LLGASRRRGAPCEAQAWFLLKIQSISMEESTQALLERELEKAEILAGFRHALDQTYRRLRETAHADWERLIGADPADACVTVRIQTDRSTATRGSGFLKSRRQRVSKAGAKGSVPTFAH
jgi:hypothetical protein